MLWVSRGTADASRVSPSVRGVVGDLHLPGAGYIGRYDIVVVVTDRQGAQLRYEVQVTLQPRRK